MPASGSSSSSRSVWTEDHSSPIPYREGPLEYEPAVRCKCGSKAARWISWSNDNPGRRYLKCFFARSGGCDFWEWYDKENMVTPFIAQLLVDLRDAVRRMKKENKELRRLLADPLSRMEEQRTLLMSQAAEANRLRNQVAEKDACKVELLGKIKKLEKERLVFMYVIVACVVLVVVLILGK